MKDNFETALRHVLRFEGGYVDHPSDPGGATNLGITRATLARYRERSVSKAEVRALDHDAARAIYRKRYWDALRCDEMPAGIDLALFDCGVNQGTGRAARLLQAALKVSADGIIGPVTMRAVRTAELPKLLSEFMALRMRAYGRLARLFRTFGLGWSRRLMATYRAALALVAASGASASTPDKEAGAQQRASETDGKESLMRFIIDRLREPSTFAGVAAFLAGVGLFGLSENEWNQVFGAIASVAGVVAMFMRDGAPSEAAEAGAEKTGGEKAES